MPLQRVKKENLAATEEARTLAKRKEVRLPATLHTFGLTCSYRPTRIASEKWQRSKNKLRWPKRTEIVQAWTTFSLDCEIQLVSNRISKRGKHANGIRPSLLHRLLLLLRWMKQIWRRVSSTSSRARVERTRFISHRRQHLLLMRREEVAERREVDRKSVV